MQRTYFDQIFHDRIEYLQQTFSNRQTEREKWNFFEEVKNTKRTKTEVDTLKNSFGDFIEVEKQTANLLNYRFSQLGHYFRKSSLNKKLPEILFHEEVFIFQPITIFTCKKLLKELNILKPPGSSNIPAWTLKDCSKTVADAFCFFVNAFINGGKFPALSARTHVTSILRKGNSEDTNNYRRISITFEELRALIGQKSNQQDPASSLPGCVS